MTTERFRRKAPAHARTGTVDDEAPTFEWDPHKSDACFRERGFDFAHATAAFRDPGRVVRAAARDTPGEIRYILSGYIDGRLFVVVYTLRFGVRRIIAARKANDREVRRHEDSAHDR